MGKSKKIKVFTIITLMVYCISFALPINVKAADNNKEVRGVWMASVWNIDWPSVGSYNNVEKQKKELTESFDYIKSLNLNTVFFQVRSMGDTMYPSNYAPWSRWLTGIEGKNPGYDPLKVAIEEAHKKGLDFHAWFNPFRIDTKGEKFDKAQYLNLLPMGNVLKSHPEWIVNYGNNNWLDISIPEVRQYVIETIMEVVINYNIDGVHMDDYFYPYPVSGVQFPDEESFKKYGAGYATKDDWRRANVNNFIRDLKISIKAKKSIVKFGISPFGIWDNGVEKGGSNTNGLSSYSQLYVDSRKWVREEMVDYIVPQIYWTDSNAVAPYNELVKWWSKQVEGKNVQLYIGQAAQMVGQGGAWNDKSQIAGQILFNRMDKNIKGHSFFSLKNLKENKLDFLSLVRSIYGNDGNSSNNEVPSDLGNKNGWNLENGKWYYYSNNAKKIGWIRDNGTWYYLNDSGIMQTGWIKLGGKWYYLNGSGAMHSGWLKWSNNWYYLYPSSGYMATNTYIDGYRINSEGVWK